MTAFVLNLVVILMTFNSADCNTISADFDFCIYSEDSEEVVCIPGVLIVDLEKNHEKVFIRMDMKSAKYIKTFPGPDPLDKGWQHLQEEEPGG